MSTKILLAHLFENNIQREEERRGEGREGKGRRGERREGRKGRAEEERIKT